MRQQMLLAIQFHRLLLLLGGHDGVLVEVTMRLHSVLSLFLVGAALQPIELLAIGSLLLGPEALLKPKCMLEHASIAVKQTAVAQDIRGEQHERALEVEHDYVREDIAEAWLDLLLALLLDAGLLLLQCFILHFLLLLCQELDLLLEAQADAALLEDKRLSERISVERLPLQH